VSDQLEAWMKEHFIVVHVGDKKMPSKLKTEINTPEMEDRVRSAAVAAGIGGAVIQTDFEHGQWWITDIETGAQWSVCDATGGDSVDGFSFEQVTEGDDQ
jgi:hypothetical protein